MTSYVLISLAKRSIAFSYYRDDSDSRVIRPFDGQWPAPLAIFSRGSSMEIGRDALQAAQRGVEGAYTDIFQIAQQDGTFEFCGNRYPLNKLLLLAIESTLRRFFRTTLFNMAGDLEANRATMHISLNFSPDIEDKDRQYVLKLLRDGGYGNVHELDYNMMAVRALKDALGKPNALIVHSDGTDLYCRLYERESQELKDKGAACIEGCGKDPRLERACKAIIKDISQDNPYADIDSSMDAIRTAAQQFVESESPSVNAVITTSDGVRCHYYLTRATIDSAATVGRNLTDNLKTAMSEMGVEAARTVVILRGRKTCNAYFRSQFNALFNDIVELTGADEDKVQAQIIEHISTAPPLSLLPLSLPREERRNPWNRKMKVTLVEAKAKAKEPLCDYANAVNLLQGFLAEAHNAGVYDFDDRLNPYIAEWQSRCREGRRPGVLPTSPNPPKPPKDAQEAVATPVVIATPTPKLDAKKTLRDARVALAEINCQLRSGGDKAAAMENLSKLQARLHIHDIHDLDTKIEQVLSACAHATPEASPRVTKATAPASPVHKLLQEGKFVEAKRQFAASGESDMVRLCASLIRASRDFGSLSAQLPNASKASAENAILRLEAIRKTYRQAHLDTTPISRLINSYKAKAK